MLVLRRAALLAGFIKACRAWPADASMGLLAVTMPPGQALAIATARDRHQYLADLVGPYLRDIMWRLWPLMAP
jgi:uncharacterized protein YbjT (DUF2867 family)